MRHRHLRAARSDDGRHRRPRRLGGPVESRGIRRRRRSARVVVVRRGVRGEPRHARDDRDPEGQARVPLPAAHADAGEERQGVALPADPPRRDDPRAHQPRRVPQVPAGKRERGAARPDGHHPGAVHARLPGRGAHLPEADHRPRRRSAKCISTRTCCTRPRCSRSSRGCTKARTRMPSSSKNVRVHAGEDAEGVSRAEAERMREKLPGRSADRRLPALRHQRALERDHPESTRRA